jgi:hypothetical protein
MSLIYNNTTISNVKAVKGDTTVNCDYVFARNAREMAKEQYHWQYVFVKNNDVVAANHASVAVNQSLQRITLTYNKSVWGSGANNRYLHLIIGYTTAECNTSNNCCWVDIIVDSSTGSFIYGPMQTLNLQNYHACAVVQCTVSDVNSTTKQIIVNVSSPLFQSPNNSSVYIKAYTRSIQ